MSSGIILDGPLQGAILRQAVEEGFVTAPVPYFLGQEGLRRKRREVLEMLLLYEKVCLNNVRYWSDDLDLTSLEREDLVELLDVADSDSRPDSDTLAYLTPFFRSALPSVLSRAGVYKMLTGAYAQLGVRSTSAARRGLVDLLCTVLVETLTTGSFADGARKGLAHPDHRAVGAFTGMLRGEEGEQLFGLLLTIMESLYALTEEAANRQVPLLTDLARSPSPLASGAVGPSATSYEEYRDCFRIYRLTLQQELGLMPKLDSITDVLRLREHKGIGRLRQALSQLTTEIRSGDGHAANRMRAEVRRASDGLRRLGKVRRVQRWTTYFSLSVAVAEAIIAAPVIGPLIAAISGGLELWSHTREKKHDWVMVLR